MRQRLWGAGLIVVGGLLLLSPLLLHAYDMVTQNALLVEAPHPALVKSRHVDLKPAALEPEPPLGTVIGTIDIPAIHVNAAVVQGTTDSLLLGAPGHFMGSVLPGESGLSVIAAHNATYFHFLNRLTPKDPIIVTTQQGQFIFKETSQAIWPANANLPDSSAPTLALEACYPLNALYLTSQRDIVFAQLVKERPARAFVSPKTLTTGSYSAHMDSVIAQQYNLHLADNNLPQGTLTYHNHAAPHVFRQFVTSEKPLELLSQAVHMILAYQDTSQHGQEHLLQSLFLPGQSPGLNPFWKMTLVQYIDRVNYQITLNAQGVATAVTVNAPNVLVDTHHVAITWRITIIQHELYLDKVTVQNL
ncbi:MAG: class D sortase [Sulfobacillus thermosulfidooxidans]|uniref:Class D sortase n=1 Tax=Sulfobacillus thermosulfidooxidans TaxID=28034 RepID=A0A2T2X0C7_SULTH|nr:MAG: class D sortase [Sulfobacillus thermosulfidooxidans]